MYLQGEEAEKDGVLQAAKSIAVAARTAPKGRGIDNLETAILTKGEEKEKLVAKMKELAEEFDAGFFARDAENVADCDAVILLGTKVGAFGIPGCNYCGFDGCDSQEESENGVCSFNAGDLGIAIGSAVSRAADLRVDNRVLYTAGRTALRLGLLGDEVKIAYGIVLNAAGKNIFFDRN